MRARRGRPAVGERVAVRLPLALLDAVDERARATERTRAATIRALLGEALADDAGSPVGPSGVDVAQIRRSLARSPAERLRHNTVAVHRIRRLQGGDSSSGIRPDLP